jgi:hypothetical protein
VLNIVNRDFANRSKRRTSFNKKVDMSPVQADHVGFLIGGLESELLDDTFWPSRVPNTVLSEANYKTVIDPSQPLDQRIAAFYDRGLWYESLGPKRPYLEQITRMVDHFGELGVINHSRW